MNGITHSWISAGRRGLGGVFVGLSLVISACPAVAQVRGTWNVNADGLWSGSSNWLNNAVAGGNTGIANFTNDITATRTVTLDTNRALGGLVFGDADTATAASWIVTTATGNVLTFNNGTGTNSTITVNNLGAGQTATISLVLAGTPTTVPSIIKDGAGTLVLGGTNTFTSKLEITSGTLQVSTDRNLGNVGTFATDRITISNGATLRTTASFTVNGARGITIGSGGGTLNLSGGALTIAAPLAGAGNTATVTGASGLILQNTSGTATNVNWDLSSNNGIRVFFEGSNALGTGAVRVRSGVRLTSQSMTTGTLTNAVTLDSGAGLTARSSGGAQTYTNVIFPSSGTLVFNKDDQATSNLTILSGGSLTGDLTVDTSPGGANPVNDVFLDGVFSGAGGIVKSGTGATGRLVLRGANTYAGNTTINSGTLRLGTGGSIANSAAIVLFTGSTAFDLVDPFALGAGQALTGLGTVSGTMTSAGTIAPGLAGGAGTLSFTGALSLGGGSILNYNLDGTNSTVGGGVNDLVSLTGDLSLDGTINVSESPANSFLSATVGNSWRLFNYTGTLTDNTLSLGTMPTLGSGLTFGIDTTTAGQVNLVVVPEPATIVTAGVGLGVLATLALRRRRARGAS